MDSYSASPPHRRGIRFKLPKSTWIAPLIACVAIVVTLLPHPHRAAAGAADPAAIGRLPAYYIAATGPTDSIYFPVYLHIGIYATATGARVAKLKVPASHPYVTAVSAAANDRSFIYATAGDTTLYLARFHPATRKVSYSAVHVPMPVHTGLEGLALSPDGSKIAYVYSWRIDRYGLTVFDIRTKQSRTWSTSTRTATGQFENFNGVGPSVSWASDNVTVAFNWFDMVAKRGHEELANSGFRLVDTAEPGGNLIARSRVVVRYVLRILTTPGDGHTYMATTSAGYLSGLAVLAPAGKTVVAGLLTLPDARDGEFASFAGATGKLEHVVGRARSLTWYLKGGALQVLWASPQGHTLIVIAPPRIPERIGVLQGSHLTMLRQPHNVVLPLVAW